MRRTPATALVLAMVLAPAGASAAHAQLLGYALGGPAGVSGFFGSSDTGLHAAAGSELLAAGRAGAGAEFGILAGGGAPLFVTSINGVFHVVPARQKLSPFLTGGFTHMSSGEGSFRAWNAGAGVDYWIKDRVGVRVEFHDHVRPDPRGTVHYWTFRAGVSVR